MVAEIAGAVSGITNLVGAGQQRKAAKEEHRNQLVQMVLANKMQNQQLQRQGTQNTSNPTKSKSTYLILGGVGFVVIVVLIFILLWKK